ncbi:MAG: toll/interleukin-1 receptor domain-containing protein, partial [Bryobacteraceae bacterium]
YISRALFNATILNGADLTAALMGRTVFANVDVQLVKGLEQVQHREPSTVGTDTIYRSGGRIPDAFLRGCGLPETFITYAHSLIGQPLQFYSCFISYSTKDQEFADRLHADLQSKGVRCWFAPHHIAAGKKMHEQIDEAIRLHQRLLLILSPASMASEWVKTEIAKARKREVTEQRRVLFPVGLVDFESLRKWECFDADTGKDSAREIREYFIPDFSGWKDHDSYQQVFERLLCDLKAEVPKP